MASKFLSRYTLYITARGQLNYMCANGPAIGPSVKGARLQGGLALSPDMLCRNSESLPRFSGKPECRGGLLPDAHPGTCPGALDRKLSRWARRVWYACPHHKWGVFAVMVQKLVEQYAYRACPVRT
jgi:hypothetical protein